MDEVKEWTIFGERLKAELDRQGLSQREYADKIGITEVTASRYIRSQRVPKATEIVATAKALGITCDYLIGLSDDPHKTAAPKRKEGNIIDDLKAFIEAEKQKKDRTLGDWTKQWILEEIISGNCKITGSATDHENKKMYVEFTFYQED